LIEAGELKHGDRQIRNSQVWHAALGEMALLPQQWVTENILGYLGPNPSLQEADAVWFVAHSADGTRYRWKIADLGRSASAV
jgi:hypothetical protein